MTGGIYRKGKKTPNSTCTLNIFLNCCSLDFRKESKIQQNAKDKETVSLRFHGDKDWEVVYRDFFRVSKISACDDAACKSYILLFTIVTKRTAKKHTDNNHKLVIREVTVRSAQYGGSGTCIIHALPRFNS